MLEYQKSSAALGLATQLIYGGKFLNTNTAVRSWERMGLVGDDFWYSSMRNPPTPSSHSELSTTATKQRAKKSNSIQLDSYFGNDGTPFARFTLNE